MESPMGQKEPLTPDQAATAEYIDDMAAQLADLARFKGLDARAAALEAYRSEVATPEPAR